MDRSLGILHLSLIPGIGPVVIKKLLELDMVSVPALYEYAAADFMRQGMNQNTATVIVNGLADTTAVFEKEVALLERLNISWTTLADSDYPGLLWHTYAPPAVLYWQGDPVWKEEGPMLSVVGSREATAYGKRAVDALVVPCIEKGMIIVSGGARGIDTMAHEAALAHGGKTIVVLGLGLAMPYPAANRRLFTQVAQGGGAVVSCFPLENEGQSWQFPIRNRIIAGMTRGSLIVQAAEKSGALITAKYALDEGRTIFAVPGPFDDPFSAGCLGLLKEGARLVSSSDDIMEEYGFAMPEKVVPEKTIVERKKGAKIVRTESVLPLFPETLEKTIIRLCAHPKGIEELAEVTEKDENELKQQLFELQLAGKIEQDFAGLWSSV